LSLKASILGGIASLESKWVKPKVTWCTVSGLAAGCGSNTADHLDNHDHDKAECNVLWVGVPQLPECIHLILGCGSLASRCWSEKLNLKDTGNSKHAKTTMLEFGLAKPVKVDANIINVRKTKRVETDISSHGTIELERQE
jgi:hypothetical protein